MRDQEVQGGYEDVIQDVRSWIADILHWIGGPAKHPRDYTVLSALNREDFGRGRHSRVQFNAHTNGGGAATI
jgi:hypothetical protein